MRLPVPLPAIRALRRGEGASAVIGSMVGAASRIAAMWSVAGADNPYSRRVALLKRMLPAIGVFLLLLIAVWPRATLGANWPQESLYFFQSPSMALAISLAAERNQFDFLRRRSLRMFATWRLLPK